MISVIVWSHNCVTLEEKDYIINSREDMITFLTDLIYKTHYGGERICLEFARIDDSGPGTPTVLFTEIKRFE